MRCIGKQVALACVAMASFSVGAQPTGQHYSVGDLEVRADSIDIQEPTLLHAKGNVVITQGDSEITTDEARIKVPARSDLFDASILKDKPAMEGEIKLYKEGFLPMVSSGANTFWWNSDKNMCLSTKVESGYYVEATQIDNTECGTQ